MRRRRPRPLTAAAGAGALLVALAAAPGHAAAQSSPLAPFDSTARNTVEAMQQDLEHLRAAQAAFYRAHHRYAMQVGQIPGFQTTRGTMIAISPDGDGGYRAVATNPALAGTELDLVEPLPPYTSPPSTTDSATSHH